MQKIQERDEINDEVGSQVRGRDGAEDGQRGQVWTTTMVIAVMITNKY